MLIDYHMHLEADEEYHRLRATREHIGAYVAQARERRIDEIAITEHCYRFREFWPVMEPLQEAARAYPAVAGMLAKSFTHSLDAYVEGLVQAKEAGLPVKVGLEVDFLPGREAAIREALAPYPWDVLLGSVHFLGAWGVDFHPEVGWPERDVDDVYREYFTTLQQAAASGLFDVLAHPDLVKKFGFRPQGDLGVLLDETVGAVAGADMAVEISTAGLRKPVGEFYPAADFLRLCRTRDIPVTLASDAHTAEDVGRDVDEAARYARECGHGKVAVFTGRQRELVPLG